MAASMDAFFLVEVWLFLLAVVFSWITYKSRKHRDSVNKKIMKDKRLHNMMKDDETVFDGKRMIYGGFKVLVSS